MDRPLWELLRGVSPVVLFCVGVLGGTFAVVGYTLVEVRVVVVQPVRIDVTSFVSVLRDGTLAVGTLGSFGLGLWNHLVGPANHRTRTNRVEVAGEDNEVTINMNVDELPAPETTKRSGKSSNPEDTEKEAKPDGDNSGDGSASTDD
jgi:hypothetical protein